MQKFIFAFAYLACVGQVAQGRRVQEIQQQAKDNVRDSSVQSLAKLLQASDPTAFQAPGMGLSRGLASSNVPRSAALPGRTAKDAIVMSKTRSKPKGEDETVGISDELQGDINQFAFLVMRLIAASVMFHHGQEKFLSAEMFTKYTMDAYFGFLPGPHIYYTYAAGFVQAVAPFFVALGVFSRVAGVGLVGCMLGAFYYSLVTGGLEGFPFSNIASAGVRTVHTYGFETPSLYIIIFAMVAIAGPGKFSISQLLGWNDDKSLFGKIKQ